MKHTHIREHISAISSSSSDDDDDDNLFFSSTKQVVVAAAPAPSKPPPAPSKPPNPNPFSSSSCSFKFKQTTLFNKKPSSKYRISVCKAKSIHEEISTMTNGGLDPFLVCLESGNECIAKSVACEILEVFEERAHGNIHVCVNETKAGDYINLGYSELFGILDGAKNAAYRLRNPLAGVVVCSRFGGDAARLFAGLVLTFSNHGRQASSKRVVKARASSAKPKAVHLKKILELCKKSNYKEELESLYFENLQFV